MHIRASDIQGMSRLVISATTGITDIVEGMHHTISRGPRRSEAHGRTDGITGFVYRSVRGVTTVVGGTLDLALLPAAALHNPPHSSTEREAVIAALNGVLGDHLAETHNPLSIRMALRPAYGASVTGEGEPAVTGRIVVLVHGLCMNDRQWLRAGHDHGAALARDRGYTPRYLHYNSGLHISTNGRAFAELLETTLAAWPVPVEELVIVGHSMGGLVARSAVHAASGASHGWLRHLRALVFLGTPHHGAPLERGGNWIDLALGAVPYVAPFARLGRVRSAGITDLRYGFLSDADWAEGDRFARHDGSRVPVPLPAGVASFAAVAGLGENAAACKGRLFGDGLVSLDSALGRHRDPAHDLALPAERTWTGYGMNHLDLLSRPDVYAQLHRWLAH